MPSVSLKQEKLMRAVAHGWKKPGGGGPSVAVAKEFAAADQASGKYEHRTMGKKQHRWNELG